MLFSIKCMYEENGFHFSLLSSLFDSHCIGYQKCTVKLFCTTRLFPPLFFSLASSTYSLTQCEGHICVGYFFLLLLEKQACYTLASVFVFQKITSKKCIFRKSIETLVVFFEKSPNLKISFRFCTTFLFYVLHLRKEYISHCNAYCLSMKWKVIQVYNR